MEWGAWHFGCALGVRRVDEFLEMSHGGQKIRTNMDVIYEQPLKEKLTWLFPFVSLCTPRYRKPKKKLDGLAAIKAFKFD